MDIPAGLILDPPNLKPWQNVPVRDHIADTFRLPTAFQNDANAAAFGEYWVGAGRDANSMVLFTLGTGVGGGIILDDMILEGEHSHGGRARPHEDRHARTAACGCGRLGLPGGLRQRHRRRQAGTGSPRQRDGSVDPAATWLTKTDEDLPAKVMFEAADGGDELAEEGRGGDRLLPGGRGTNLMHMIDPDMVVFGGGMIAGGGAVPEPHPPSHQGLAFPVPAAKTNVRYAQLGSDAGFIGAAACGRQWAKRA